MKKWRVLEVSFCLLDLISVAAVLLQFECHSTGVTVEAGVMAGSFPLCIV